MNVSSADFSNTIRSAPGWLIALIAVIVVVALVLAGPLLGLVIKRRREAEMAGIFQRPGLSRQHGQWIETGEMDLTSLRAEELRREREAVRAEIEAIESDPVTVISDNRPTSIITIISEANVSLTKPIAKPSWAEQSTAAWSAVEYVEEVHDGVLVEEPVLTEAEQQFYADPLGSWVLPPEVAPEYDFLPEADRVFRDLVERNWLTGEGFDVEAEWKSWNLYEEANA